MYYLPHFCKICCSRLQLLKTLNFALCRPFILLFRCDVASHFQNLNINQYSNATKPMPLLSSFCLQFIALQRFFKLQVECIIILPLLFHTLKTKLCITNPGPAAKNGSSKANSCALKCLLIFVCSL